MIMSMLVVYYVLPFVGNNAHINAFTGLFGVSDKYLRHLKLYSGFVGELVLLTHHYFIYSGSYGAHTKYGGSNFILHP